MEDTNPEPFARLSAARRSELRAYFGPDAERAAAALQEIAFPSAPTLARDSVRGYTTETRGGMVRPGTPED